MPLKKVNDGRYPALLLPRQLLQGWRGARGPSDPAANADGFETDYERACAKGFVATVAVGPGVGLVFLRESAPISWVQLTPSCALIVREAASDGSSFTEELIDSIVRAPHFTDTGVTFDLHERECLFLPAAFAGDEAEATAVPVFLEPGLYEVATERRSTEHAELLVHRLQRSG